MNFQKTYILGRVSHTPELKALPTGTKVATFSMATNRTWKDTNGEKKEQVEWHNVIAFGKLADIIGQYVEGGQELFIEGRNQTRSWDGEDGKKRYRTEVIVEGFQFGAKSGTRAEKGKESKPTPTVEGSGYTGDLADSGIDYPQDAINLDDIPF